ncbi:Hypothetical protein NGAL_HAMBI490_32650 [Neorhizobium galegae bv. officinalis]|nr:hypothetical protein [Neorhizobium galegae]MCQ1800198.1 hypothetical protein [Neorhizobium galegae]CDZ28406.1 Hypothetical protein NGAL_HAMBI490_32650 [Neorhizobium galegae bv. officinalis]
MSGILEKRAELQAQADAIVGALSLDDALRSATANTPGSGKPSPSALIYEAALDGEVTTTAEFEEWLLRQQKL